ncbi:hypothetical protein V7O66_04485 [Methanolobus sp. ZRKC3]|uniref:hypothetical protein n=1 Tax=Methanolobus sp. ZRKC3 TaxID=3125786 RepID=UPI00324FD2C6
MLVKEKVLILSTLLMLLKERIQRIPGKRCSVFLFRLEDGGFSKSNLHYMKWNYEGMKLYYGCSCTKKTGVRGCGGRGGEVVTMDAPVKKRDEEGKGEGEGLVT